MRSEYSTPARLSLEAIKLIFVDGGVMTVTRYCLLLASLLYLFLTPAALLSEEAMMLEGEALARVVPGSFYFEGRIGPTQMRNAAAGSLRPIRDLRQVRIVGALRRKVRFEPATLSAGAMKKRAT